MTFQDQSGLNHRVTTWQNGIVIAVADNEAKTVWRGGRDDFLEAFKEATDDALIQFPIHSITK